MHQPCLLVHQLTLELCQGLSGPAGSTSVHELSKPSSKSALWWTLWVLFFSYGQCYLDLKSKYKNVLLRIRRRQPGPSPMERTVCFGSYLKTRRSCCMLLFKLKLWGWKYFNQSKYFSKIHIGFVLLSVKLSETLSWKVLVGFEKIVFVWVEGTRRRVNVAFPRFPHLKVTSRSCWSCRVGQRKLPGRIPGPNRALNTCWPCLRESCRVSLRPCGSSPLSSFSKTSAASGGIMPFGQQLPLGFGSPQSDRWPFCPQKCKARKSGPCHQTE